MHFYPVRRLRLLVRCGLDMFQILERGFRVTMLVRVRGKG
jgi:hypothetical protein